MAANSPTSPESATWVAAVHASREDYTPLGSAVVIDRRRVLTCDHVIVAAGNKQDSDLWVAFPRADDPTTSTRRRVLRLDRAEGNVQDVAVLELDGEVPAGVQAAPLRCPKPQDLVGRQWWAFGFPDGDPYGDSASGTVGTALAYGWIRLDTSSRYLVRPGFSGGGLWSLEYEAVVAVVGQAHANGDGRAISLHQANLYLPEQDIAGLARWSAPAAGEVALAAWGWALDTDREGVRHWRPRARGVSSESERGYRFRGRKAALTFVNHWLVRQSLDRRVLVITGSPGVGKSAVLGRIVTTADAKIQASLPEEDDAVRAEVGSVACAVHSKGKTALEVAVEIARAASAAIPATPMDLALSLRDALDGRGGQRFNVVIDALDEAASPSQARMIIREVVLSVAQTCSSSGAQVIVGTRRHDDGGSLLEAFGRSAMTVDLDATEYFEADDLVAYSLACLQLAGDERVDGPYTDTVAALPLARRIAALAGRNFLVAGLVARSHGLYDEQPVDPSRIAVDGTVRSALSNYLDRIPPIGAVTAAQALTALAFAQAPGFPLPLWQAVIKSLYGSATSARDLLRLAHSSGADFLVESAGADGDPSFRLFHAALNDSLLAVQAGVAPRAFDERDIAEALIQYGRTVGWGNAPEYLLRSLPAHAAAGRLIDDLLLDDRYLVHADIWRLMLAAGAATSTASRQRVQLLGLTQEAALVESYERAALFSVTDTVEHLNTGFDPSGMNALYVARWAQRRAAATAGPPVGHHGAVNAVCSVSVSGRHLLATAGGDQTVRLWDPETRRQLAVLDGHQGWVRGICSVRVAGHPVIASGGDDRTIRLWDPVAGTPLRILEGHTGRVSGLCSIRLADEEALASASSDQTVRVWDPTSGQELAVLEGHEGWVRGVCTVRVSGRELLASCGDDRTVRLWDLNDRQQVAILHGHEDWVRAVCSVPVEGCDLLASAGSDGTVRLWDPAERQLLAVLAGHEGWVRGVCSVRVGELDLLASGGDDQTVRLWDAARGEPLAVFDGHEGWVRGVCSVRVGELDLLASGGDDQAVRLWDPVDRRQWAVLEGHRGAVRSVCSVTVAGQDVLASGGADETVRLWDPADGRLTAVFTAHAGGVNGVCSVRAAGRVLLASGGEDQAVRLWDPVDRRQWAVLEGHRGPVRSVCSVTVAGQDVLASGGADETVRLWHPADGRQLRVLDAPRGAVTALCPVRVGGRDVLVSAGDDQTVRIWDPQTGVALREIPMHHRVLAVTGDAGVLSIGLVVGVIVVELGPV